MNSESISPNPRHLGKSRRNDLNRYILPLSICSAAYIHCVIISWRKWGDLIFDAGREMELPARMAEGAVLYVDVRNLYGPLPAYLNSFLYQLFGIHLDVLIGAGLASAAAMGIILYSLSRRFLDPLASAIVVATFYYACAFAHLTSNSIFNFIIPYSYAATYGMLAAAGSILFVVRYLQTSKDGCLLLSLFFGATAFLCKIEAALAVACAHTAYVLGAIFLKKITTRKFFAYGLAISGVAGVYGLLYLKVGPGLWDDNILSALGTPQTDEARPIFRYASWTMGLDDILDSLKSIGISCAYLGLTALFAVLGDLLLRHDPLDSGKKYLVSLGIGLMVCGIYSSAPVTLPLRVLPVLTLVIMGWLAISLVKTPDNRFEILPHFILWAFIAACLSRQLLRVVPEHYGFYLLPVPIAGLAIAISRYLPKLARSTSDNGLSYRVVALGVLIGISVGCYKQSSMEYARHKFRIDTPRGSLILRDERNKAIVDVLSRLPRTYKAIVVPQGAGFVFLSGLVWNDGTFAYSPSDLVANYRDERLPIIWSKQPPDVVIYYRLAGSYGAPEFGYGYGDRSLRWLLSNYSFVLHPQGFAVGLRSFVPAPRN